MSFLLQTHYLVLFLFIHLNAKKSKKVSRGSYGLSCAYKFQVNYEERFCRMVRNMANFAKGEISKTSDAHDTKPLQKEINYTEFK
jgi:hypothetical protein